MPSAVQFLLHDEINTIHQQLPADGTDETGRMIRGRDARGRDHQVRRVVGGGALW